MNGGHNTSHPICDWHSSHRVRFYVLLNWTWAVLCDHDGSGVIWLQRQDYKDAMHFHLILRGWSFLEPSNYMVKKSSNHVERHVKVFQPTVPVEFQLPASNDTRHVSEQASRDSSSQPLSHPHWHMEQGWAAIAKPAQIADSGGK